MICNHCSNFRRGEGGPLLGGAVALSMVPACPCAALPRVVYGDDQSKGPLSTNEIFPNYYVYEANWRFCSVGAALQLFEITGVECLNYASETLLLSAAASVCYGSPVGCTRIGGFDPVGSSSWNNIGVPVSSIPFNTSGTGEFFVIEMSIVVFDAAPFPEMPQLRIDYKFNPET